MGSVYLHLKAFPTVFFAHISAHIWKLRNLCNFKFFLSYNHYTVQICINKCYFNTLNRGIIELMSWGKQAFNGHFGGLKSMIFLCKKSNPQQMLIIVIVVMQDSICFHLIYIFNRNNCHIWLKLKRIAMCTYKPWGQIFKL